MLSMSPAKRFTVYSFRPSVNTLFLWHKASRLRSMKNIQFLFALSQGRKVHSKAVFPKVRPKSRKGQLLTRIIELHRSKKNYINFLKADGSPQKFYAAKSVFRKLLSSLCKFVNVRDLFLFLNFVKDRRLFKR